MDLLARLERRTVKADCWTWTGSLDRKGYGRIRLDGRIISTHRAAYALLVGPIPDDRVMDHLCRNRACWNPAHLEPVTAGTNTERGLRAAHSFTGMCRKGLHDVTLPGAIQVVPGDHPRCIECARLTRRLSAQRQRDRKRIR